MSTDTRLVVGLRVTLLVVLTALAASCAKPEHLQDSGVKPPGCEAPSGPVRGQLKKNTRWCHDVTVDGNILVPRGVTLTIEPGTTVRFKAYRGYKEPEKRLRVRVEGRLIANGAPGKLIWFTSHQGAPQNGDWSMIKLVGARGSRISYAVFEFSQHGLNIWNTDIELSHVVIRFNNWEGLYIENKSKVVLSRSRIYANGYNCIAIEQFNHLTVKDSYIANCGTMGIHVDASEAHIQGNLIEGSQEGVSLDNDAKVTVVGNRFSAQKNAAISCGEGKNQLSMGNNVWDGIPENLAVACEDAQIKELESKVTPPLTLVTGVSEGDSRYLDYIPGNVRHDKYRYVYPPLDETRHVVKQLGGGLGLTWSVTWDGEALWTANLDGQVMRLDPRTGKVLKKFTAPGPQPWGMTFDGKKLWINDFARRRIYAVDPRNGKVLSHFTAPDPAGGCKGLAWDGKHLYALGWATHKLYTLSPNGRVIRSVPVPWRDIGGGVRVYVAGGLTWDGKTFWAPGDKLVRFGRDGKFIGWLHSTSERVWDLAWDGEALWTTQRANENWTKIPRLYRVKILKQQKTWKQR